MKRATIQNIIASEKLNSFGVPALDVEIITSNGIRTHAFALIRSVYGSLEANKLSGNDTNQYGEKNILKVIYSINEIIVPELIGKSVFEQQEIDNIVLLLDNSKEKLKNEPNVRLAISLAVAIAAANEFNIPLFRYLGGINANSLPIPLLNILNNGSKKFSLISIGDLAFEENVRMYMKIFYSLKKLLKNEEILIHVNWNGELVVNLNSEDKIIEILLEAINDAGYIVNKDVKIFVDITSVERCYYGIEEGVIINPNQIGTISEILEKIKITQKEKNKIIISSNLEELNCEFIADLAVATNADYIKTESPFLGKIEVLNRLLTINDMLR